MTSTPTAASWRTHQVFIASTFRDLDAERDHLQAFVFPALAERLRAHRRDLVPIDLRWGVDTVSTEDEEEKELLVVKVCLSEIERSRPFFIALLGDRYGWVPPPERSARAATEAGFDGRVEGKSVTAMEIEHGALDDPTGRSRSVFYLRDPLPYEQMAPELAAAYSDGHATDPDAPARAEALRRLKERLEREQPGRIRRYRAHWDPVEEQVTGLEAFGTQVLEDLWSLFLDELDGLDAHAGSSTWEDEERAALADLVHDRSRSFVGREALVDRVVTGLVGDDPCRRVLVGPSGSGKSALFARIVQLLHDEDVLVLAHSAGASQRSTSVEPVLERWIGELARHLDVDPRPPERRPGAADRLQRLQDRFTELLATAAASGPTVVLVDALDQMEGVGGVDLTWLHEGWPASVGSLVTSRPSARCGPLVEAGAQQIELGPLSQDERRELVRAVCGRYRRALHPEVEEALVGDEEGADRTPLWLHLAAEELLLLDADDYERLGEMHGSPEERLHHLLLATARDLPRSVPELYDQMLDRTEATYDAEVARAFAELLATTRYGLREGDARALLRRLTDREEDDGIDLDLAAVRRGYRAHLVQRGDDHWFVAHREAHEALGRRVRDRTRLRELSAAFADHLRTLPADDPYRRSDTMYHLVMAGDTEGGAAYLAEDDLPPGAGRAATHWLAKAVVEGADHDPNPGLAFVQDLLAEVERSGPDPAATVGARISSSLWDDLDSAPSELQLQLVGTMRGLVARARARGAEHGDLALSHLESDLGEVLARLGALPEAHAALSTTIELLESALDGPSAPPEAALALARVELVAATVASGLGRDEEGLQHSERAVARLAAVRGAEGDLDLDDRLADALVQRGQALVEAGRLDDALVVLEGGLDLREALFRRGAGSSQPALGSALEALGALHLRRGELDRARPLLARSLDLRRSNLSHRPGNPVAAQQLAAALHWQARVLEADGERLEARTAMEEAVTLQAQVHEALPATVSHLRDLIAALLHLAELQRSLDADSDAMAALERALVLLDELEALAPARADLASGRLLVRGELADLLVARGDRAAALEQVQASLSEAKERLTEGPADPQLERQLGAATAGLIVLSWQLSDARADLGDLDGARAALAVAVEPALDWFRAEPSDLERASHVRTHLGLLASAHEEAGDHPARRLALEQAAAPAEVLHRSAPEDRDEVRLYSEVMHDLGRARHAGGEPGLAIEASASAIAALERWLDDHPDDDEVREDLVWPWLHLGDLAEQQGDPSGAAAHRARAGALVAELRARGVTLRPGLDEL